MAITIDILWHVGLGLCLLAGWLLAVFQLPGTWFIVAAATVYDWHFEWGSITWQVLAVMALLASAAEVADLLAGMKGAQKAGASRAASWGALVGGICGMIAFTPLIPVPILGSILGGLLGCFGGAFVVERYFHGDTGKSAKVGLGAAIGRLIGLLIKLMTAVVLSGIAVGAAIPWGSAN